jgi:hypothetical protein
MTEPRPPLRLVGSPPNRDGAHDVELDAVDRSPHDLHPPYHELAVVEDG